MEAIVLPFGYKLQVPFGKFTNWVFSPKNMRMQTVGETRRNRLEMLIKLHGNRLANLNEALGYERTHSQLARIRNRNARTDRPGKFYDMGDDQAREIEKKLCLPVGWMDTQPSYAEIHGENDPMAKAMAVMAHMPNHQWPKVLQMLDIFAQPESKNGTS